MAPSETNELGNGREDRRGAAIGQDDNVRAKYRKFKAQGDFNPDNRRGDRHGDRRSFDFPVREGDNGAIIIVDGNGAAVQPRVKRRPQLGGRHEQPHGQRQQGGRQIKTLAQTTVQLRYF
jgi:hypothetical protein